MKPVLRRRVWGIAVSAMVVTSAPLTAQEPSRRLTLGDAARLGAERSVAVMAGMTRVEGAQARVKEATGQLLPSLSADAIRGARTFNTASFGLEFPAIPGMDPFFDPGGEVVGPVRSADVRAHVEVPLVDLAALGRRKGAQAGVDVAREELAALRDVAASTAARAYVAVLRTRGEVSAREEDRELARELVDVARGQLEAGVAVALDVTRAQAQLATVEAQLLSARHRAEAAELSLRRALRLEETDSLELTDSLTTLEPLPVPEVEGTVDAALEQRGDLRTLEAYRAAANESVSAVKAGRLPRLVASVDEGFYGKNFQRMLRTYSWTVRLSVPVFDGFQRSARIQQEEARAKDLSYRLQDLEDEVAFQVHQAILNVDAAQEQVAAADERLRLAELEVAQEEERVLAGVAGTADVVRAALRLNEARTADLDVRAAVLMARVALASAMGMVTDLP